MFHDIYSALKNELKNVIFKSWFHLIRFGGLLLIPLIYGFSYIFAFYDPFPGINNLKISVITGTQSEDPFGYALGESLKKAPVKIGDLNMKLEMQHIYIKAVDEKSTIPTEEQYNTISKQIKKIETDSYATIEARGSKGANLSYFIAKAIRDMITTSNAAGAGHIDTSTLIKTIVDLKNLHFQVTPNFKKNYLIAFGVNVGTSMQGTYITVIREALETLINPDFLDATHTDASGTNSIKFNDGTTALDEKQAIKDYVAELKQSVGMNANEINPVTLNTNMSEHSKYGFGLAPFFISVAMWVGGMTMTFAVHRKIYDKNVTPGHRYFAKWILIVCGTIVQATILMLSLYFIGFKTLGIDHWGQMYFFSIVIGIVFATIIQAIRFTIHSRNIGIFITIILLVLQMTSAGGLFPIQTQTGFYQGLNILLPMSKTVNIIRETAFDTNWSHIFTNLGYLFIYLLIVPFAVVINHHRTLAIYKKHNFQLPNKTLQWIEYKQYRKDKINSKRKAPHKKGGV